VTHVENGLSQDGKFSIVGNWVSVDLFAGFLGCAWEIRTDCTKLSIGNL